VKCQSKTQIGICWKLEENEKIMKGRVLGKKKRVMKNKNIMVKSLERGPNLSRS
jgi:hypothetical protein